MTTTFSTHHRTLLVLGCSLAALAAPARAESPATPKVIFSSSKPAVSIVPGQPVKVSGGTTQFRLPGGATVSLVGPADFTVTPSGALQLRAGSATLVNDGAAPLQLALPGGVTGSISPRGTASLNTSGTTGSGSVMGGTLTLAGPSGQRSFNAGSFWSTAGSQIARTVAAPPAKVTDSPAPAQPKATPAPAPSTPAIRNASASQWLQAGFPAALAQQLAAAGANAEVIAAARRVQAYTANPVIAAFPRGDYALLAAQAAQAAQLYGQPVFNGAQADIITAYFQFLAAGRTGSSFLTAYGQILNSYLDLLRAGTLPSSFTGASQAQLNAWVAYLGRTSGYGGLTADNQTLLNAYLAFLKGGGTPDSFAPTLSSLTAAYLDYVRAGNDPATFTKLSQSLLLQYLTIVQSGGIKAQLTAQNQAFIDAYIASLKASGNGLAFLATQANALNAYLAYLNAGGLPSQYTALDQATLRAYLQALINAGLLNLKLGQNAAFYQAYYSYLSGGGSADAYAQLPANIWTSYAAALNAYYAYLAAGGVPTAYTQLTQAQILAYLQTLVSSGKFAALIGTNASFFNGYYTYLNGGGAPNSYASLPAATPAPAPTPAPVTSGTVIASYQGGFTPGSSTSLYMAGPTFSIGGWFRSGAPGITSAGALAPSGAITATAVDVAGDSLGVIGRYTGGNFATTASNSGTSGTSVSIPTNSGLAYAYMAPITGTLPTDSTVVNYDLYAATQPTYGDGHTAPGTFAANLSIKLGATPTYKMSGTLKMPDASYTFTSPGASTGAYASVQSAQKDFFVLWPTLSKTGPACTSSNCILDFYGAFAGATPQNRLGFAYNSFDGTGNGSAQITGAALFAAPGSYTAGAGTGAGAGNGAGTGSGTGGGSAGTGATTTAASQLSSADLTYYAGYEPRGYKQVVTGYIPSGPSPLAADGTISTTSAYKLGTATNSDTGSYGGVVGWTRWSNGTVINTATNTTLNVNANNGMALIWGQSATNLPASGAVTYSLVGGTKPVVVDGSVAPGTLNSASFNYDFGLGNSSFNANLTLGGSTINLTATGSAANGSTQGTGSATGYGSGSTSAAYTGHLYGSGGSAAGVAYQVISTGLPSIAGTAIFAAPTTTYSNGSGGTGGTGTSTGTGTGTSTGSGTTTGPTSGGPYQLRITGLPFDFLTSAASTGILGSSYQDEAAYVLGGVDVHSSTQVPVSIFRPDAVTESGSDGGVIAWERWTGGNINTDHAGAKAVPANGGVSLIYGTPVTNMPTSGTVNYTMVGGTQPTVVAGGLSPGQIVNANLTVAFGSTPKAGFSAAFSMPGVNVNYTIASAGGTANPSMAISSTGSFSETTTLSNIYGFLAGPGASNAGVSYTIGNPALPAISGVIAFRKGP